LARVKCTIEKEADMPRLIDTVPIPGSTFMMELELFPSLTEGYGILPKLGKLDFKCPHCGSKKFRSGSGGGYDIYCNKCDARLPVSEWKESTHRSVRWHYDPIPPEATNYGKD